MHAVSASSFLAGYYVISLRPAGAHDGLRRAAARHGARTFALPPWRLAGRDDPASRSALGAALGSDIVIFTSPPAVAAARALQPLAPSASGRCWVAVGAATARALRGAGIPEVHAPQRMDSEGLLALPVLERVSGRSVGLVTAPGGRGVIAPTLAAAGARVVRADVYARLPLRPSPARIAALQALPGPWLLPLSSGEALELTLAHLPPALFERLRGALVVTASARLAGLARGHGFANVHTARDARPASLLAAAEAVVQRTPGNC